MNKSFEVHQLKTEGIAQFAYIVESQGEALIVDPLRDIKPYIQFLSDHKLTLKYIYLTHTHADFVAGHAPLAKATKAAFLIGKDTKFQGEFNPLKEGDIIKVGSVELHVLETPGHTLDSTCLVLYNEGAPHAVFTGDTSFIGEVGRPDLSVDPALTPDVLAKHLYASIQKLKKLPAETILYPGHGSGSACGKNIGKGDTSTIGKEIETNYAYRAATEQEFVSKVTENAPTAPEYFFHDVKLNESNETQETQTVVDKLDKNITLKQLRDFALGGEVKVIDCRPLDEFHSHFLSHMYSTPFGNQFEFLVAVFIKPKEKIAVFCKTDERKKVLTKLVNIGYENIVGVFDGPIEEAKDETDKLKTTTVAIFAKDKLYKDYGVIDVRDSHEQEKYVAGALLLPARKLLDIHHHVEKGKKHYVYCQGGGRAVNATRILHDMGFDVTAVLPGFKEIPDAGVPLEERKK